MKKRINILLVLLLLTGCTCEYDLKISKETYKEEIKLIASNTEENNQLNQKWIIPINREIYNHPGDSETPIPADTEIYKYTLSGNTLIFSYNFDGNQYQKSSAVANCYNTLTVTNYMNSMILSTSKNAICFEQYPTLTNLIVNITIDGKVSSHNADRVNGNVYTWQINRNNASSKAINLVIDNLNDEPTTSKLNNNSSTNSTTKKDYTLYIFCGILLIVIVVIYIIFNKIKNNEKDNDI